MYVSIFPNSSNIKYKDVLAGLVKIHCNFKQPRIFIYNLLLYIKTITNYSNNILFLLNL